MPASAVIVGIACALEAADIARLEALDPRIAVRVIAPEALADAASAQAVLASIEGIEVLLTPRWPWPTAAIGVAFPPSLRWVQFAHDDGRTVMHLRDGRIESTTSADSRAAALAEWVLTDMLLFAKRWPEALRHQHAHEYARFMPGELAGATVGIVAAGAIGAEIAWRASLFDCRVLVMRPSDADALPEADEADEADEAGGMHEVLSREQLPRLLAESDYLVLASSATAATRNLIDAAALRAMKSSAVLINVGGGELVDEAALVEALRTGAIAGAALGLTAQEPLPPDSPLWDAPNLVLTPRADRSELGDVTRATDVFLEHLRRYLAGQPPTSDI